MSEIDTGHIRFVLCHPRDPRNVTAAWKAVSAMGFKSVYVVTENPAIRSSIPASRGVVVRESLYDAIHDAGIAWGVTRRSGQRRKMVAYGLNELVEIMCRPCVDGVGDEDIGGHSDGANVSEPGGPTAFVFGNETSGLSDEELCRCNGVISIPTNPECPSLNLSHAVALVAYRVSLLTVRDSPAIDIQSMDAIISSVLADLHDSGFLTQTGPQGMEVFLRDLFTRAGLNDREAHEIRELFSAIRRNGSATS